MVRECFVFCSIFRCGVRECEEEIYEQSKGAPEETGEEGETTSKGKKEKVEEGDDKGAKGK